MEETVQEEDLEKLVEQHQEQYTKHRSQSDATQGMSQKVVLEKKWVKKSIKVKRIWTKFIK